jgi:GT2 family glycosyltransferase
MKFSIIIVTRNSASTLWPCLESISRNSPEAQYEVIIVDNASQDRSLNIFPALEGKVKILRNEFNLGFARACNQGLKIARGEFLVLLNPDTIVTSDWLEKLSFHLRKPDVGAVGPLSNYVAGGQKSQLYLNLKNPSSPDEMNFILEREFPRQSVETPLLIGFCLMFSRKTMEKVGYLDDDLVLGNEDLEFCFRLQQHGLQTIIALDTFIHHQGQASFKLQEDPERWVNFSARILQAKLKRKLSDFNPRKIWGIDWFQPRPNPEQDLVSIIIPTCNGLKFTQLCLDSIRRSTLHPYEVIIVDNASTDGTLDYLRRQQDVILIENPNNRGFPSACNQGISKSTAPYILLLNNDVIVSDGWLNRMFAGFLAAPDIGMVGPRSNDSAGFQQINATGIESIEDIERFSRRLKEISSRSFREVDFLSGFCLLIDRRVVEKIGLLDERFGLGNYEDQDYCRRALEAGFRLLIANEVYVHHFGSRSFLENRIPYREILNKNRQLFEAKWALNEG